MTVLTLPVEQFTQTRYRCPYCRRSWTSLKRANEHRDRCWFNRGCKTCRHGCGPGAGYIDECAQGVDLWDADEERPVLRSQCPLWAALDGEAS